MSKYRAVATLTDGERQWDVQLYRGYEGLGYALESIKHFSPHGYDIVRIRIEKEEEGKGCGVCKYWEKRMSNEPCKSCQHYSKFEKKEN